MQEIIDAPWEVKSDSFFFAEGRLLVHNRAEYNYAPLEWAHASSLDLHSVGTIVCSS